MSDLGTYTALETEIRTALTTVPIVGIVDVKLSSSLADLVSDSIRKPVIGIVLTGTEKVQNIAIGRKDFMAVTHWTIGLVISTARPSSDNRTKLYSYMEQIRDRLHFLQSNISPKAKFEFISENYPTEDAELIAASISFDLSVILGK